MILRSGERIHPQFQESPQIIRKMGWISDLIGAQNATCNQLKSKLNSEFLRLKDKTPKNNLGQTQKEKGSARNHSNVR
jgi:hypothetical protein